MTEIYQHPSFAEFDSFMQKVVDPVLKSWKFRKIKRRGIGRNPPVDLVQLYRKTLRGGRTFGIQFTVFGAFQPLETMRLSVTLYSSKDKYSGRGPGYYRTPLVYVLWDAGVTGDFIGNGWRIGDLLSQHRASSNVTMLTLLEVYGLPWLEQQPSFPDSDVEQSLSKWHLVGSHPTDAIPR